MKPEESISLELLKAIMSFMSPEFQTQDRREFANKAKDLFMKDPELLSLFEKKFSSFERELAEIEPSSKEIDSFNELESYGWKKGDELACPAAVVAAAAATWGAAAAQGAVSRRNLSSD